MECDIYDNKTGNEKHKKLFSKFQKDIHSYDDFPVDGGDKHFLCIWYLYQLFSQNAGIRHR